MSTLPRRQTTSLATSASRERPGPPLAWRAVRSVSPPRLADVATADPDVADPETVPDLPWVVIVWNDPINLMSYVALVFRKLFGYSEAEAEKLMLDVHHRGRAVVSSGTRDEAERDVARLHEHGLWATMQKDD